MYVCYVCVCVCVFLNVASDFLFFNFLFLYSINVYKTALCLRVARWWFINSAIKLITVDNIYIYTYLCIKPKIKKYHRVFVCNDYCAWRIVWTE